MIPLSITKHTYILRKELSRDIWAHLNDIKGVRIKFNAMRRTQLVINIHHFSKDSIVLNRRIDAQISGSIRVI